MQSISAFFGRHSIAIRYALVIIAVILLAYQISRPLVDYDEATYAKVVMDTIHSGDISTFTLSGHEWFEKPPLYLWMAIGSVMIFGDHEFAYRLPGLFLTVLTLLILYELVKELTDDDLWAAVAALFLLFSKLFLMFAREARTDQGMILCIVAAFFFLCEGMEGTKIFVRCVPRYGYRFFVQERRRGVRSAGNLSLRSLLPQLVVGKE